MNLSTFTESITFFYTRDLAKTAQFYEQLLGLQLVLDQGECRIYQVSPSGFLGFCERGIVSERPEGVIFTFVTDDVDGWARRLSAKGVFLEKEPAPNPNYNIYNCFFRDPNGYLLEIQRFLDSDWMMGNTVKYSSG